MMDRLLFSDSTKPQKPEGLVNQLFKSWPTFNAKNWAVFYSKPYRKTFKNVEGMEVLVFRDFAARKN